MIGISEENKYDGDASQAVAKKEAKRVQALFKEVFETAEAEEALNIIRKYFDVDVPSAAASGFDSGKAFYMDGHKAVFKLINDIIKGEYNED